MVERSNRSATTTCPASSAGRMTRWTRSARAARNRNSSATGDISWGNLSATLRAASATVVPLHLILGGLAPLLRRPLDILGDALDLREQLPASCVLLHPLAGPEQHLVFVALSQEPPQLARLLVDHVPPSPSMLASRNRGRPNRSSYTATRDQSCRRASARTASARRSSISSATNPPGASRARAPASRARVAVSPSSPLTSASRGSNSRTAGSSSACSASVRYGGFETMAR